MKNVTYYILLCALLAITFNAHAQDKDKNKIMVHTADSLFNSLHGQGKFNGNVLLAEHGHILYKKSFGLANEQTKTPLNEYSVFELASCSKQFTAMAIAILANEGKLSLDDEISIYFPGLSYYKGVTIRNLLYHTSGLPDYMRLEDSIWQSWDEHKIATNKDVIAIFEKHKPKLLFEPGTKHEYSNTGYLLLASIIEKVSGMSFGAYLSQKIFKPLGMKQSLVYNRRYAPRKVENYALGYVTDDSLHKKVLPDSFLPTQYVYNLDGIVGDGAVNSTVHDLLKWDNALYTDKLLPANKRKELFESGRLKNDSLAHYGFGWFIKDKPDGTKTVSHSGGWPGYITYIERDLQTHRTIIMLQNTSDGVIPKKEVRLLMDGKPIPPAEVLKEVLLPENILSFYTGQYQLDPEFILTITKEGQQLYAQATGQGRIPIYASSETKFFNKDVAVRMEFVKDGEKIKEMIFQQGGTTIAAPRIN
ncbi:MAG: serine hydrolase [Taibaiella sp.]|jgi:CubicO group peptidase (beta-lactamase class C family)